MKLLSATLLLISSNAGVVFGSNIRGSGLGKEQEQLEPTSILDTRKNDEAKGGQSNIFGGSNKPGNGGNGKGNGKKGNDVEDDTPFPNPPTEVDEDGPLPPPSDNEDNPIADVTAIAMEMGFSLEDTQELINQQNDFAELVDLMQEDRNFLQAEMPSEPNGEFVLMYKNGNIPLERQDAIEKFKTKNMKANVKSKGTKLSLADAEGRGERLSRKLEQKGYLHVSFSIDGDGIEVTAKKSKKSSNHDKGTDKGKISNARAAEILKVPANDSDLDDFSLTLVEYDGEDPAEPFHTYGGRKISGNGYQCTTAFSVVSSTGRTGVATAAHCTGMNVYDALSPESDYATYFQKQHRGQYGDMEWYATPHFDVPEYYAAPTKRWSVRSVANSISKGQWVCGYSRMQGTRKCSTVYKTSVSLQYSGLPRMYKLVAMSSRMMVGGDSGGPWSYNDKAFGIVSGGAVIDGAWRDIWSRVSYLWPALGVKVRTK